MTHRFARRLRRARRDGRARICRPRRLARKQRGTKWTPDTANGWAAGKTLVFPDESGVPDAEGVKLAGGDANRIYVSIERNDSGPAADISRPAVLRNDVTSAARRWC